MGSQYDVLDVDGLLSQATCAIVTTKDEDSRIVATAWLFSDQGHLATAGHTFSDMQAGSNIWVQFLDEVPVEAILEKSEYDREKGIDFAILRLTSLPTSKRIPLRIMLVDKNVEGKFTLKGFGKSLGENLSIGKGEILGFDNRGRSSENKMLQLRSPELAYEGFSGGAVYSTMFDAVIGIQTEAVSNTQTILAMPLFRVKHWKEIEEFATGPGTCFVIAPKDRLAKLTNEVVRPVIAEELRYKVKTSEPEDISNNLTNIEQAELIIVDVTDNQPNIIYELAVGHSAGIPDIILGERSKGWFKNRLTNREAR